MKYEQYTSLIKRLEEFSAANPSAYRTRVVLLASLGYTYFLFIILLALTIPVGLIALIWNFPGLLVILLKLGKFGILVAIFAIAALGFIWSIFKVLWFRIPPPEGVKLRPADAPRLFELIDQASDALGTPRPQHVLLNDEFNASIVALPRRGGLTSESYLNVGLPLMQALSPEQFRAVVGHELGHLSNKHGSYAAWIYRLRESWARFLTTQSASENGQSVSFLYSKFLNWYFPYFNAYTFVLAREQEREADACAVRLSGVKNAAEALINCELKASTVGSNFWKEILSDAAVSPNPPKQIFSRMALAFRQSGDDSQSVLALTKVLSTRTDYSDTHPCLADRLTAMGYWRKSEIVQPDELPPLPAAPEKSAAEYFLGKTADHFTQKFDREWQTRVADQWKARHQYLREAQKRIDELNALDSEKGLEADELYERASLIADRHGERESLPYFEEIVLLHPKHAAANFTVGSLLLADGDERGIKFIKEAIKTEPQAALQGNEKIFLFLQTQGREAEAKPYLEKAERAYERLEAAQKERETITSGDNFEPPTLAPDALRAVQEIVIQHEEIKAAYLVRKAVKNMPEHPCHVLCLEVKRKLITLFSSDALISGVSQADFLQMIIHRIDGLNIEFVLIFNKDVKAIERKVLKIPGAKIYEN